MDLSLVEQNTLLSKCTTRWKVNMILKLSLNGPRSVVAGSETKSSSGCSFMIELIPESCSKGKQILSEVLWMCFLQCKFCGKFLTSGAASLLKNVGMSLWGTHNEKRGILTYDEITFASLELFRGIAMDIIILGCLNI